MEKRPVRGLQQVTQCNDEIKLQGSRRGRARPRGPQVLDVAPQSCRAAQPRLPVSPLLPLVQCQEVRVRATSFSRRAESSRPVVTARNNNRCHFLPEPNSSGQTGDTPGHGGQLLESCFVFSAPASHTAQGHVVATVRDQELSHELLTRRARATALVPSREGIPEASTRQGGRPAFSTSTCTKTCVCSCPDTHSQHPGDSLNRERKAGRSQPAPTGPGTGLALVVCSSLLGRTDVRKSEAGGAAGIEPGPPPPPLLLSSSFFPSLPLSWFARSFSLLPFFLPHVRRRQS